MTVVNLTLASWYRANQSSVDEALAKALLAAANQVGPQVVAQATSRVQSEQVRRAA